MAEETLPLPAPVAEVLLLGALIAARDASRVALGGVHLGTSAFELVVMGVLVGALRRTAGVKRVVRRFAAAHPRPVAVRRHRSSSKSAFSAAYHVTTE